MTLDLTEPLSSRMRDDPQRRFLGPGHYTPIKIEVARRLRRESTPAEQVAWSILRRGGIDGWHFRRQQVVEGFIVDFFCAKLRLVIEIDGGVHDEVSAFGSTGIAMSS